MPPFLVVGHLEAWLTQLGSHYAPYAEPLWEAGVRTIQELSNASASTLRQAGVQLDLHLDNIKATAARQGVCWEMRKGKIPGLSPSSHMADLGWAWLQVIAHGMRPWTPASVHKSCLGFAECSRPE